MNPTIKDVANHAKVSIATVSLVVHNNQRISATTRNKVLKSIKELNYHPSKSAQALVQQKTGNIGFILTDDHFLRTEPFYTRIFLGTEFIARSSDYYILLETVKSNFASGDKLPRFVRERNVDGVIIAGKVPNALIEKICSFKIPIVFVDYQTDQCDFPTVIIDNIQGGMTATKHLIDYGHTKIGFIGGDIGHPSISDRLFGYKRAIENAGIPLNNKIIITDAEYPDRQNGYSAAKRLFKNSKNITALFACNDAMAIGAMQYLKDNNIKIPDEVSLIGFDDVEADLLLDPPLTTMKVPKIDLGLEAFNLLTDILKTKNNSQKKLLVPVELIIRNSTKKIE